jgi:DNA modification methylase
MKPYYEHAGITIYHGDCREIVPQLGRFDLLLTDPPYGIGAASVCFYGLKQRKNSAAPPRDYGDSSWDSVPVSDELLSMVRQQCGKQIIWGGNYFNLPPCKGPLVWDKQNGLTDFADGEIAWNNLGCAVRMFRLLWAGMLKGGEARGIPRVHPTQKPVELMSWCIRLAGDVQTILDPFMGSGTTLRAAKNLNRKAVGIEIDERYCEIAAERMQQEVIQFGEDARAGQGECPGTACNSGRDAMPLTLWNDDK